VITTQQCTLERRHGTKLKPSTSRKCDWKKAYIRSKSDTHDQHSHAGAPGYLADDCQLVTDARARQLRSADMRTLSVHRTSTCFRDRTFAAAATRMWNSLPPDLRKADLSCSRSPGSGGRWRHFLFGQSDHGAL